MHNQKKNRKIKTFFTIATSIFTLISLYCIIIYFRYPLQREIVLEHYLFLILFSSLCFSVVLIAFANFLINNGEKRERQGLPFFETKITFKKILLYTILILTTVTYYFWDNILDLDLSLKREYSYIKKATFIKSNVSYGRYSSQKRWYYTFVNRENDTLILNSHYENPTLSKIELNTTKLLIEYLPNTKSLQSVTIEKQTNF